MVGNLTYLSCLPPFHSKFFRTPIHSPVKESPPVNHTKMIHFSFYFRKGTYFENISYYLKESPTGCKVLAGMLANVHIFSWIAKRCLSIARARSSKVVNMKRYRWSMFSNISSSTTSTVHLVRFRHREISDIQ